ncbi:hypothetical protein IFM89_014868 [Coptis chinensis]|uniref:FAR1 domain-containing protein n=1 Tax=Coptis chinensis TaxID=261450 RepID=A0A835IE17_9MAGN|nr:hypothetical protein IFM89_014868 [Coptis chinensis]
MEDQRSGRLAQSYRHPCQVPKSDTTKTANGSRREQDRVRLNLDGSMIAGGYGAWWSNRIAREKFGGVFYGSGGGGRSPIRMDDSILIDEVGEHEEYGSVLEPSAAFSSSVQPLEFEVEVEIVKPPCLGMCFETLEAAKQFYIDYGKSFEFSLVIRSSEKSFSRSDEVSSCQMTCSRFGVYRDRGGKNKNVDGT